MADIQSNKAQVVIVGSGPTGLSLGIELARRGIRCLLVERNLRVGHAPRAKTTNVRTREHLRRWGIAGKLADASPFGVDYPSHVHFVTRLSGQSLLRFDHALNAKPERDDRYSEHAQWVPQYKLEGVLKDHAATLDPLALRYGEELIGFTQDANGVRVRLRNTDSGEIWEVVADFLVGADGARSVVRDLIGSTMKGRYGLSRNYNIIFEAPGLAKAHDHGPGIMYWQINADGPSVVGPMDIGDLWYFMPTQIAPDAHLTDEEAVALIRQSTGIDLPYRIKSSDEWVASCLLADKYWEGRVFLAGDACHLHPPFGGFGMNMGVGDAVDLGWKLAAVLQGWGGPTLLPSYEAERRPVHELVLDEAERNHAVLSNEIYRPGLEDDTVEGANARSDCADFIRERKYREFYALSVVLGYSYAGSPLVAAEAGATSAGPEALDYVPDAVPGSLAPHAWLEDDVSLYDLFGNGFTLLVLGGDAVDVGVARQEAERAGVPLTIVRRDEPELRTLYEARLALIRPDQHVAWRGDRWPDIRLLARVTGQVDAA
ncbi:MAG: FAD-monooxygenase [Sphingomonas bacterium]|uniref:FAD-dependent oxidoreductase n=1 Tax=Sphingomonas bacterium TaxID=1895847 RepID=UPI002612347A|nr:FAD-dependent oxidoreductase [Sphingomonas bacterium]MDB5712130.1 FAD-monooxygenase [Sphingomonas bacterium]